MRKKARPAAPAPAPADDHEDLTQDGWEVATALDATEPRLEDFGDYAGGTDDDATAAATAAGSEMDFDSLRPLEETM